MIGKATVGVLFHVVMALAAWSQASAAETSGTTAASPMNVLIGYLGQTTAVAPPRSSLIPPPANEGIDGAGQGIADNNTTGRFVGQRFELKDSRIPADGDLAEAFRALVQSGLRLILVDLPEAKLLAVADLPEARDVTLFDVRTTEDSLRGTDCRANVLHTAPSRAMLADALIQYLIVKQWPNVFLVVGPTEADRAYAAAMKRSITKFRAHLVAEKNWTYAPGAKRSDSGHYSQAAQVAEFTQGVPHYDILIVADEDDEFGDYLSYATVEPRPVAGTQGLVPAAWSRPHQEFGATQLQSRFLHRFGRWMTSRDYAAWLAVRAIGEAATRTASVDARKIDAYLRGDQFELPGYKGEALSFRPWDGQMRQPILLSDSEALVSVSPQPGFLHPSSGLDTLGVDRPESQCHAK